MRQEKRWTFVKVTYFDFFLLLDLEADDFFAFVAILVSFLCAIKHADFVILRFHFEKIKSNKKKIDLISEKYFLWILENAIRMYCQKEITVVDQNDKYPNHSLSSLASASFLLQKRSDGSFFRVKNVQSRRN